jgi:hypothetical protein
VKKDCEQQKQFDDALPERFVQAGDSAEPRKLRIAHGEAPPSPYIVKLTRPTADALQQTAVSSVHAEIEALAKSLIIDGDDDVAVPRIDEEEGLSLDALDISSQLREFDTALPDRPAFETRRPTVDARPAVSLDAALASIAEAPISLDALVPILVVSDEQVAESVAEDTIPTSPWVFGEAESQRPNAESVGLSQSEPDAERLASNSAVSRFFRFELGVFQHATVRALGAFVALSFAVVLPLHAMQTLSGSVQDVSGVQHVGTAALDDIVRGTAAFTAKDFGAAESNFSSAAEKFASAEDVLNDVHAGLVALVNVIPQTNRTYDSVRGLMTAGQELSQTASIMSQAGEGLTEYRSRDIVAKLGMLSAYVENALPHAQLAEASLAKVDPSVVPESYKDDIVLLQAQVPEVVSSMNEFLRLVDTLAYLLGGDGTMRYLALFQNNTELRATGGFVGSFAEIDIQNGAIADLTLPGGGTYDIQGQLKEFVEAPEPLALINPRWEFQDGNWFPDFPTSAKKMQWFYEHGGGPTTDGVIAVNATFLEKLLEVIGPVEIPEYDVTIDSENFLFTTEKIVEVDFGTTATPKAFLGDLAPLILEKIQNADTKLLLQVIAVVEAGMQQRDIQLYFRDNNAQRVMHDLGYDGAIAQTAGDYLMVVNTNIGGGKTDVVIEQDVDVAVDIAASGSIVDTVTITKTHKGMANALFTGKNNVDYIRVYVPEGSVLLSASGFEVPPDALFEESDVALIPDDDLSIVMSDKTYDAVTGVDIWNEFGKTVFGGWMQTAPGETETVTFSYRIPQVLFADIEEDSLKTQLRRTIGFDEHDSYSMFVQKQSGVVSRNTTVTVNAPSSLSLLWTNVRSDDVYTVPMTNIRDNFLGWIFTR